MKTKYITTELHPELKEGIVFNREREASYCYYRTEDKTQLYIEQHIADGLEKGYIKEVQEPKWTDQDMIDFLNFSGLSYTANYSNLALNEFKKKNNK